MKKICNFFTIFPVYLIAAAPLLFGCDSISHDTRQLSIRDAWTNEVIASGRYSIFPDGRVLKKLYKTGRGKSKALWIGNVNNTSIEEIAAQDLGPQVPFWHEGKPFKSLRNLNAYLASTGVKEKRIRVILHE